MKVVWNVGLQVWDSAEMKSGVQGLLVLWMLMKVNCQLEVRRMTTSAHGLLLVLLIV